MHAARRLVAQALVATTALLAFPAITVAQSGLPVVGLLIVDVQPNARVVNAVLHCWVGVPPENPHRLTTFNVAAGVDLSALGSGQIVGATINPTLTPPMIFALGPNPCDAGPQDDRPPPGGPGKPGSGPEGDDRGDFAPSFLSRVWKFVGESDGYENGKLKMTIGKMLNLPKKFRHQDDDLIDEDAIALVGKARIIGKNGKRASKSALKDAEEVRVHGKLLPQRKWRKDEDGEHVATIRAKKVYITG